MTRDVFVGDFAYALGDQRESLGSAARRGLLASPEDAMKHGGFEQHYDCSSAASAYDLAFQAARALRLQGSDIDALIYATCIPENGSRCDRKAFASSGDVRDLMQFPASHLQAEMNISGPVFGLDQQACTGMLGALRLARSLILSEPEFTRILCVTADRFPEGARYEQAYNLISDGAAACVVSEQPADFRILACHHVTNGAQVSASDEETLGSYFAQTCATIQACLNKAGLGIDDIDWIVPQNTHRDAWRVLCSLLGFPFEKVCLDTLSEVGHVISADNVINLTCLLERGLPEPGQRVLLPMAGYGSNWQCVALARSGS
jgi:3-oxoacyl-[acyl-carrier-protein] synthase-3